MFRIHRLWRAMNLLARLPEVSRIEEMGPLMPNDVIIINIEGHISQAHADRIHAFMASVWPSNKCIVLTDGMKISVLRGWTRQVDMVRQRLTQAISL